MYLLTERKQLSAYYTFNRLLHVSPVFGHHRADFTTKNTKVVASHAQLKNRKTLPKPASYECLPTVTSSRNTGLNLESVKLEVFEQQIGFVRSRR
jgi:hypothetical protein